MKVGAVLGLLLLAWGTAAFAEAGDPGAASPPPAVEPKPYAPIPDRRLSISHLLVFTYNALGLEYQLKPGVQYRLWKSDDLLLRDTFTFAGAFVRINPVYTAAGPLVEWQPLAVLNLRARAEALGYYGVLGLVESWRSPYDDYSDTAQRALTAAGDYYSTWGMHGVLEPTLQAKVGPIALVNRFSLEYWDVRLRNGDTILYDAGPDHALPGRGWTMQEEATLVYLNGALTAGLNFRYARPLFTEAQFRPGEDPRGVDDSNARLGLLFAYTLFDRGYTAFNKPTVFILMDWWLHHRYRTGVDVPQGIPFLAVGLSFQQDFVF